MISTRTVVALAGMGMAMGQVVTTRFDCSKEQAKFQIGFDAAKRQYFLAKNGAMLVWSVEAGTIRDMDACDISPKDDTMYCIVKRDGIPSGTNFNYDLVRVDSATGSLAYIAAAARDSNGCNGATNTGDCGFQGAAFDDSGDYIARSNDGLLFLSAPHAQVGYSAPTDLLGLSRASTVIHGYDMAVLGGKVVSIKNSGAGTPQVITSPVADAVSGTYNEAAYTLLPTAGSLTLPGSDTGYNSAAVYQGAMLVQHDTQGVFKIVPSADGQKVTVSKVNVQVPMGGSRDGSSCKYVACLCPQNGIANANSWCPATSPQKCHSCGDGHHIGPNGVCLPNRCTCPNGQVAASCPAHEAVACASCSAGYFGPKCLPNQCSCRNGKGKTGTACSSHGSEECASCHAGYRPLGDLCVKKHPKPTTKPSCFCNSGLADPACADPSQESCVRCYSGFRLVGSSCLATGDVGSMSAVGAAAPSPGLNRAMAISGFSEDRPSETEGGAVFSPLKGVALASAGVIVGLAAVAAAAVRSRRCRTDGQGEEQLVERGFGMAQVE